MKIEPFPGKLGKRRKTHAMAYVLTQEQEAWLRKWFPLVENSRLSEASGMSHSTLHRFAREMHLTKSERGLHGIKRRQAQHIKRLCECNGYYASMRGRPVSEACRQGTAQMWQDIREGKREHPFAVMKRENPRKYYDWMQRKSKERKETIRKERLRLKYGMERKTRLKSVVLYKYTKRQTSHRYNAVKRGYIVMEDCTEQGGERYNIYYDNNTQRTPLFERKLKADGFRVREWNKPTNYTK